MPNSLLSVITRYADLDTKQLDDHYASKIGINQTGDRLEYFVKDLIADSFDAPDKETKDAAHKQHLSWTGSQNHPPDLMLKGQEAVEVKKTNGKHPKLPLNSSPPRQKLHSSTTRINNDCRACEDDIGGWEQKDLVYTIGSRVSKDQLGFMWMVYGDCWCDKNAFYTGIATEISAQIKATVGGNDKIDIATDTNELGKIREADVHGRTKMRIRGMWSLKHPATEFKQYITEYNRKISDAQPLLL